MCWVKKHNSVNTCSPPTCIYTIISKNERDYSTNILVFSSNDFFLPCVIDCSPNHNFLLYLSLMCTTRMIICCAILPSLSLVRELVWIYFSINISSVGKNLIFDLVHMSIWCYLHISWPWQVITITAEDFFLVSAISQCQFRRRSPKEPILTIRRCAD